ncbi:PAS domain S-box protein [Mucilaginibacter sp. 21P]|uniref:PAS domain-containing sensor histidine kinase n=1 Tax=Mucilaginibacter sp. 21P TaxID=2778902 RepID=UPI001C581C53|nr:HAMP domain-containing sensor histidine kinase [Mucilaginibacter sp. 21P]QXV64271.1 PAS domain S-box protein [Mucilaginibacter sp. 21P]
MYSTLPNLGRTYKNNVVVSYYKLVSLKPTFYPILQTMTDYAELLKQLQLQVDSLQGENLELKRSQRKEIDSRDINDAASEMLRINQLRYRTIFENSLLGNKIIGSDLKILQVNQALVDMLGYQSKNEITGKIIIEFAHPDYAGDWQILQQRLWSKRLPSFNLETRLVKKNGESIWVNVISMLFRDGNDMLGFTTIEDISDRRSEFDVLRMREENFRTITNIIPQQVFTAAPNGKLVFVNKQVCDYLGKTDAEIIQKGWDESIHPEDVEKCRAAWSTSVQSGKDFTIEFRLKNEQDDYRWFLGRATALRNDEDSITLWLGTNTDIQAQKDNEHRKDEFLSIVSHELRTPLTSIKLYNQLSQKNGSPEKQAEFTSKSKSHIIRLERLITDLLDVSRINAGKMTYNIETFDFDKLIKETVDSLQLLNNNHELVVQECDPIEIKGDKHRIEQVLNNLILNAIKYSPDATQVIINSKVISDSIIVSIQDFGIGIKEKDLTRLFDRYYRVDNSSMRFDGLGMGLYISAEILKRHNGSLWIESEPGKGSTFNFLLPINGERNLTVVDTDNKTFYSANFIEVRYNEEKGWLETEWLGYQNLESVKKGCMAILEMVKAAKYTQILNDNTLVRGNWSEAADWGASFWFPALREAGLKQFAWIYSPSAFSRLAADRSVQTDLGDFQTHFFTDKESAEEWLGRQKMFDRV